MLSNDERRKDGGREEPNTKLLKSKILTKKRKMGIYQILIRPVIMYGANVMIMIKTDEENLKVAKKKYKN